MTYLTDADVRDLLAGHDLRPALATALSSIASGTCVVPGRTTLGSADGFLGLMPGYVPGLGLAAKLLTVYASNHAAGLPSHQGVVVSFDQATGTPIAIIQAAALTAIRTARASALAVD
ncbi:MAG: ornithine cyclodeaminase family protein, partial [Actinobacteria bacterium]|nr:ornithine cyclodeaminase family protein [Actinomycetota bacterium]